jgi:pimeloyl-ACP methyl ester carboxylesterase
MSAWHTAMAAGGLAATVTHGRAISIDGAAHYPNMERPDAYNEIIKEYLS